MGFFIKKTKVKLEDFCRNFYNKNLLDGTIYGVDVNTTYYKGIQDFIGEVFPEFLNVDFEKLKEEFTILRFELFALAWFHSFGEEMSVLQSVFTMKFLEEENKQDIWKRMQRYCGAIATGVRKSICTNENDNTKLDSDRINIITSYLSKIINLDKNDFSDEDKKYTEAINRVGARIKSEKGWKDHIILSLLSFTMLRNLGFTDDEIQKVLNDKPLGHIMNVLNGFYNGAKESWEDVKIIKDDNSYKQEEIIKNQTGIKSNIAMNDTYNTQPEIILRKDKEWSFIDGQLCLITDFHPLSGSIVKDGEVISPISTEPYASIKVECNKLSKNATGFITHKIGFFNLWSAFNERGIDEENEEVLIYWTTKHYKNSAIKILSTIMLSLLGASNLPKIIVMICPKGTFKSCPEGFPLLPNKKVRVFVYGLMSKKYWIPDVIE